jgi:hypothetical protein
MQTLIFATATALLGISSLMANVVLYDNGGPDQNTGDEMTQLIQAEDFMLSVNAGIGGVRFWALDSSPSAYQGSIAWAIGADAGGSPGSILASGSAIATLTNTGNTVVVNPQSLSEKLVSFMIPQFLATSGTTYWLELHNGPTASATNSGFYWETSSSSPLGDVNTGHQFSLPSADFWGDTGNEHAFQLTEVPEPSGLALFATMIGFAVFTMRRENRTARSNRAVKGLGQA